MHEQHTHKPSCCRAHANTSIAGDVERLHNCSSFHLLQEPSTIYIRATMLKSQLGDIDVTDDEYFKNGDFTLVSWDKRRFKISSALLFAARYVVSLCWC